MSMQEQAEEFRGSVLEYASLDRDTETPAKKLGAKRIEVRETMNVAARRLASAAATETAEQAALLNSAALDLQRQAEAKRNQAERAQATAVGTVRGLFGGPAETIVSKRCLKAAELDSEAAALEGQADALKTDAAGTTFVQGPVDAGKVTEARIRELAPAQLARSIDNLLDAAVNGRIVEG